MSDVSSSIGSKRALRLAYGLSQGARVAWYLGHYAATRRIVGPLRDKNTPPPDSTAKAPNRQALLKAVTDLFAADWRNVEAGVYAAPHDLAPKPLSGLRKARAYLKDVPQVDGRRRSKSHSEVLNDERRSRFPRYYLQNFHYQTGGWLDDASAEIYDTQVEVLFSGTADAMRRQALVPLAQALAGRDQRDVAMLDVACGTGRFLTFVCDNYPRLNLTTVDMSPNYLAKAKRTLRRWRNVTFINANAEHLPVADGSQDVVTCVYLFHELPPKIRRGVAAEMARVLKPGGRLIFVDALQKGDAADMDGLLDFFPWAFHEPYFGSYTKENLAKLFAGTGLVQVSETPAFLSKVLTFEKA
ncbi:class I SAM-dependent methyltransferase [Pyruvatibacter sp.]|uniref:class I SAM-dependent methyltransferase n=1 Tax=Pyruvatibacter sp. TaxID=1981328 RepID=UPI0032EABF2A